MHDAEGRGVLPSAIDQTRVVYKEDGLDVLYECFRHKVAHLALAAGGPRSVDNPGARARRPLRRWSRRAR
jgi:hypothetical protein